MLHNIDSDKFGHLGKPMSDAVTACVHCGFCLPTCPTYRELGQEMDSPRGRIILMKQVMEGKLDPLDAQPHIDRCLGCLACETSCPSGVVYRDLISPYRAIQDSKVKRSPMESLKRWLIMETLPYPNRFRVAATVGRWGRSLRPLLPRTLRPMIDLLPEKLPRADRLPSRIAATGKPRARVALLTGCVQQALDPSINRATVDVLTRNDVEVLVPPKQSCCGSLAWHVGEADMARKFARRLLNAFPEDIDAIIVNASGCGAGIHEYPHFFLGRSEEKKATLLAERVVDIATFLDRLGIDPPPPLEAPLRVAYHDACHLSHGQRVRSAPRRLLQCIEGLQLMEIRDGEICCGSAGTYNLDQPDIAASLGRKKAEAIQATRCDLVAMGNIGCMVQINRHLKSLGPDSPVALHTAQILAKAYAGNLND